jgi:hypothetical protein
LPVPAQVVAQDARGAAVGDRRRGAVLEERILRRGEEEPAVGREVGRLEAEVRPDAVVRPDQEVLRHRQVAQERAAERVAAHERVDASGRDALGGEDQLAVAGEREALGIEALGRVGLAVGREQHRDAREVHVAVGQPAVGHVDAGGVEPRPDLVVGEEVVVAATRVVGD